MIVFGFLAVTQAFSAPSVTLAWDANPEPDIAGYRLSYGSSPGSYSTVVDVGNNMTTEVAGLIQSQTYYFSVSAYNSSGLTSPPSPEISYTFEIIPTGNLRLHYVDSEDPDGYRAEYAFDGNPNTFWHTEWRTTTTPPPHELQIDLGSVQDIRGFRYLARQDAYDNGNIGDYEFYVSLDGIQWGNPVAVGTFLNTREEREVLFSPKSGRYVRLRALSDVLGSPVTNVAELTILQVDDVPNTAPSALAQTLSIAEDTPLILNLHGTDLEKSSLSYLLVTGPAHGTLTGTAPNLTYTPTANFSGSDSFTFRVNDGALDSSPATVSIAVIPINDAPVAQGKSILTPEDTPVTVTLSGIDFENNPLTFIVVDLPVNGTLKGTAPNLIFSPLADFSGLDRFTYRINDGTEDSATATVLITVTPVNDAPVATSKMVATRENTPLAIVLSGGDKDLNHLTFNIVTGPSNGTLSGTSPDFSYRPNINFTGSDSFTYRANDGTVNSPAATVSININAINDAPAPIAKSISTAEDTPVAIVLTGTDVDGDLVTFEIVTGPTNGALAGKSPNLIYTPSENFTGADSFTYRVSDGKLESAASSVSIAVTAVNDAPVAFSKSVNTPRNTALPITIGGSDVEGNSLSYAVQTQPAHGTLSGTAPDLIYQPASGFAGNDQFTFRANDGMANSAPVTISIRVAPPIDVPENSLPAFTSSEFAFDGREDSTFTGLLTATDADPTDALTFSRVSGPSWLSVSHTGEMSGTPLNSDVGMAIFTVAVSDLSNASATATVKILVENTNDAPSFAFNPLVYPAATEKTLYRDQSLAATASDPDHGDSFTYSKIAGPPWLDVAPSGELGGTPPAGSAGPNSFAIRATDTGGSFSDITLNIEVNANTLPLPWTFYRVGTGNIDGSARYKAGTFTVAGAGSLDPNEDSGNFGWQTLSGDGEITARVRTLGATGSGTRVGVMIRESLAENSRQVFLGIDESGKLHWLRRSTAGAETSQTVRKSASKSAVKWLRLVRKSKTITAFQSIDGKSWTKIGTTGLTFPTNAYIGLSVSSGDDETLNTSQFSNVRVKP